jgi:hypothetical protein
VTKPPPPTDTRFAHTRARGGLLTAQQLADHLGASRAWVYEHAHELEPLRLGTGPKARLRFDLERVLEALSCSPSRGSLPPEPPAPAAKARCRRASALGTTVELLPIRGQIRGR